MRLFFRSMLAVFLGISFCSTLLAEAPKMELPVEPVVAGMTQEQPEVDEGIFRDVAKELRCPTCTGLSVLESDASFSVQIKDQVKQQLARGKHKEEVLQYFVQRYGPWILREPPREGFSLLAWLIPSLLLCLGPLLIWLLVWKRRVQVDTHGVRTSDAILEEMRERLKLLRQSGS